MFPLGIREERKDIYRWLAARNLPISDSCLRTAPLPINRNFDASV